MTVQYAAKYLRICKSALFLSLINLTLAPVESVLFN